jgi:predicted RNA-binding Zn-ribbon protein involved in translation (DUF1610 family)
VKNKKYIIDSPIFVFKKIHKCPDCKQEIIPKKIKRTVNSKSIEAKEFDLSCGDSFLTGDIEYYYHVFYCKNCDKEYEIRYIKNYERKERELEIRNKYKNKMIIKIKLFLNKLY